jgi:hypothetical protein
MKINGDGDWLRRERPNIYEPIPRDRDQAYTKFDGFLLKPMMKLSWHQSPTKFSDRK